MIDSTTYNRFASDPAAFRAALTVDVDGVARRFGDVMDDWQAKDFAALDPALQRCNGRKADDGAKMRAFIERPRGASKTTDLAVLCVWALTFATFQMRAAAYAADKDQADLLRQAIERLVRLNPWLGAIIEVQRGLVVNTAAGHPGEGSTLRIESSDVGSSYGQLLDMLIIDEIVHWEENAGSNLWSSLVSTAAKRSNCALVVITNAGFVESWQWQVREAARTDEAWYFSRLDGVASWMTPKRLEEQRRMLPAIAFARLWLNQWSSGGGDALTEDDIKAAFIDGLEPMRGDEPDTLFIGGLDLGLTRDCSAFVVLAVSDGGRSSTIRLAHHKLWRGVPGAKVNISDIERHVLDIDTQFDLEFVTYDPWQAEHLAQRLEQLTLHRRRITTIYKPLRPRGNAPWMREVQPTAANLRAQATLTIESFQDRRLKFYPCEPLKRDLQKLRVEEKSYGIRLVSPRDGEGHGDTFSALANALLVAHELAGKKPNVVGAPGYSGLNTPSIGEPQWQREARERAELRYEMDRYLHERHQEEQQLNGPPEWVEMMRICGRQR